jgi:hypothetical protein
MGAREQLRVRVDDKLVLDAGTCEEVSGPHGPGLPQFVEREFRDFLLCGVFEAGSAVLRDRPVPGVW